MVHGIVCLLRIFLCSISNQPTSQLVRQSALFGFLSLTRADSHLASRIHVIILSISCSFFFYFPLVICVFFFHNLLPKIWIYVDTGTDHKTQFVFCIFYFVSIVNACFCFASFARIRKHCWDRDPGKCSNRKSMCICMDCSFVWRTVNKSKRYINTDFHKGQQIFEYFFYWFLSHFFSLSLRCLRVSVGSE